MTGNEPLGPAKSRDTAARGPRAQPEAASRSPSRSGTGEVPVGRTSTRHRRPSPRRARVTSASPTRAQRSPARGQNSVFARPSAPSCSTGANKGGGGGARGRGRGGGPAELGAEGARGHRLLPPHASRTDDAPAALHTLRAGDDACLSPPSQKQWRAGQERVGAVAGLETGSKQRRALAMARRLLI